jgi:hypothetical protein
MKDNETCERVRELRQHYGVADLIELVWKMYEVRLCPGTVPRIIRDESNDCQLCAAKFYAQKDKTTYCPNCRAQRSAEVLADSRETRATVGPAGNFAGVGNAWLYGQHPVANYKTIEDTANNGSEKKENGDT